MREISVTLAVLLLQVIVLFPLSAQEVIISKIQLRERDVIIHYELKDPILERKYSLFLYTSSDNYILPLEKVSGDIGVDIAVGGNKKVVWHAGEEQGESFKGDLAFELKGSVYTPFIYFDGFEDYKEFKRGKPYELVWSGGRGDNILNFELYRGENKVHVFEERPNIGGTSLVIPTKIKAGKNYRLKISDKRNRDEVVFTSEFTIKRKVPLPVKLGVLFAVGVGTGLLVDYFIKDEIPVPDLPSR